MYYSLWQTDQENYVVRRTSVKSLVFCSPFVTSRSFVSYGMPAAFAVINTARQGALIGKIYSVGLGPRLAPEPIAAIRNCRNNSHFMNELNHFDC